MSAVSRLFPYFTAGVVIKGFGRGSKDLGIPTANFSEDVVDKLPAEIECGVYYGWAQVGNDNNVYEMVMSIGWNPFYKNEKKSMETHVLHTFKNDFYGELLKVALVGYIRKERSFNSKEDLINAIHEDIEKARTLLREPDNVAIAKHSFFQNNLKLQNGFKL